MGRFRLAIALLAGAAAAGCGWAGRDFPRSPLAPRSAARPVAPGAVGGAAQEEVNPAVVGPTQVARPRETRPDQTPSALTQPARPARYEARLEDVPLPLEREKPPLLDDTRAASPRLVNAVLAEVNGEVITREDILGPLRPQMEQWRREFSPEAFEARCRQVVEMRLRQAVSQRLVVQEAKARLSEKEKEEVERALGLTVKDMTSQAGSPILLEQKLRSQGTTLDEEKQKERDRLLVQRFLREKIAPAVHVTHSELLAEYNRVRDERYVVPTKVHLALIMLKKSESPDAAQARALAQAVHERAAAGEDFARLAQRYSRDPMASKGGDWGLVTQGSFRVKEVDQVLFTLAPGQVGPLVETDDAFYIVKALARQEGRVVPFTEVQGDLEDEIRDRKYNAMVSKYIQGLYERAYVRVMLENL